MVTVQATRARQHETATDVCNAHRIRHEKCARGSNESRRGDSADAFVPCEANRTL